MLDSRLQAAADFVAPGARVADIGTDHAYLAVNLAQEKNASYIVAADKNHGPCVAASRTVSDAGLKDKIIIREGDGLAVLEPGEVDTVCIAGMGGVLIAEIIEAQPAVVEKLDQLILQPMQGIAELRKRLYKLGWHIDDESLVEADKRIYVIISAKKGAAEMPRDTQLAIGPCLINVDSPLYGRYVENIINAAKKRARGLELSRDKAGSEEYRQAVEWVNKLEAEIK